MKILFVINSFYTTGNGLATSARRTVKYLKEAGQDVRVLSRKNPDPDGEQPDYVLPPFELPGVFGKIVAEQGYAFSAWDDDEIHRALQWADVAHMEEPFPAQGRVCTIAAEMGVPCTCTYHIHPENLFASVHLMHSRVFNGATMAIWRHWVFNKCVLMQAPSENAKERLLEWHVKPEIRVISNGIIPERQRPAADESRKVPPYVIMCVGRYSYEKDQMTLLRAMKYSRFADRIQIVFAGKGPVEKKLKRASEKLIDRKVLKYAPVFEFMDYEELQKLSVNADLLVHCAVVEVEGMSIMEAVQNDVVPVIAEGKLTAASQFAKSEMSRFPAGNAKALASRIDYWLENDERRKAEALKYRDFGKEHDIAKSVGQLVTMFHDASLRRLPHGETRTVHLKDVTDAGF